MHQFEVIFYRLSDGSCPVSNFLDSLDTKMRARLLRLILLLEINGNELREPYSKSLGGGIYELRARQSSNITRMLYFFTSDRKIILTNGFTKKTLKTPLSELHTARKYRKDYLKGDRYHE